MHDVVPLTQAASPRCLEGQMSLSEEEVPVVGIWVVAALAGTMTNAGARVPGRGDWRVSVGWMGDGRCRQGGCYALGRDGVYVGDNVVG